MTMEDVAVWQMNGTQKQVDQVVSQMSNDWHFLATGDFNGDHKTDLLWRNDDGDVAVWQMNGTQKQVDHVVSQMSNDWHFLATGDFNGDGKTDLLWRNDDGDVAVWQMNGARSRSIRSSPKWATTGISSPPATSTATAKPTCCGAMTMETLQSGK